MLPRLTSNFPSSSLSLLSSRDFRLVLPHPAELLFLLGHQGQNAIVFNLNSSKLFSSKALLFYRKLEFEECVQRALAEMLVLHLDYFKFMSLGIVTYIIPIFSHHRKGSSTEH
jgi:hypothetical protein